MKRSAKHKDEPLGRLGVVADFLPPPDQLVLKVDGVKVTISLSKRSVDFFKVHASRSKVPYQRMIRSLLDNYASQYAKRAGRYTSQDVHNALSPKKAPKSRPADVKEAIRTYIRKRRARG
jgi:hypothetical protein